MSYSIKPYDLNWVSQFENIKSILEQVFGSQAIAIEHIGSTSILGMNAKPVIDMLVIVEKIWPFISEKQAMSKLGYQRLDNYIAPDSALFFKTDKDGDKTENVHVCIKDSAKTKQLIGMRDYFRAHQDKVKKYNDLKEALQHKFPNDYIAYKDGKKEFLELIRKEADDWSKNKTCITT